MAAIVSVTYEAMATTGSSRATEAGRVSALKHADIFCTNKQIGFNGDGIAAFGRLSGGEICNQDFFKKFATYLAKHVLGQNTGTLLKPGSAIQYLSGVKDFAQKKFSANPSRLIRGIYFCVLPSKPRLIVGYLPMGTRHQRALKSLVEIC